MTKKLFGACNFTDKHINNLAEFSLGIYLDGLQENLDHLEGRVFGSVDTAQRFELAKLLFCEKKKKFSDMFCCSVTGIMKMRPKLLSPIFSKNRLFRFF